jgi:hypothetical protein
MIFFIIFYIIVTYIVGLGMWVEDVTDEPLIDFLFYALSPILVPFYIGRKLGKL